MSTPTDEQLRTAFRILSVALEGTQRRATLSLLEKFHTRISDLKIENLKLQQKIVELETQIASGTVGETTSTTATQTPPTEQQEIVS